MEKIVIPALDKVMEEKYVMVGKSIDKVGEI